MRDYEVVYIFQSALAPEEIEGRLDRYHGVLTKDGGQVTAVEHWGKRQLAYPIRNETNGYYVVAQFTTDPSVLSELEPMLKLDEQLLRHLIVLSEGELPLPSSMAPEGTREEDDEDDEVDEVDEGDEEED